MSEPWRCDFCPALATRIVGDIGGTLACDEHAWLFLHDADIGDVWCCRTCHNLGRSEGHPDPCNCRFEADQ